VAVEGVGRGGNSNQMGCSARVGTSNSASVFQARASSFFKHVMKMWGYDQDNGYLFQLKDRCKCATIVPSEREHFEMSKLQLGKCSFEGEGSGSKPLCYDGIPLSNPDSEKNYCCQSTCLVDATGSPQCDGKGCSSLVAGISNCCASQLGTKVCTAPGDTGCYTTEDVGFKSFEGAMLQQFVYKQLLP